LETQDLKKVGLKATLPRLRILQILEESDQKHLSAEDVYKALLEMHEDVGLATVYRVLTQFELTLAILYLSLILAGIMII